VERFSFGSKFLLVCQEYIVVIKIKQGHEYGYPRNISSAQAKLDSSFEAMTQLSRPIKY
jgi:hypothetical protein